jgi:mobilome CxxCx(11)CxxC protein
MRGYLHQPEVAFEFDANYGSVLLPRALQKKDRLFSRTNMATDEQRQDCWNQALYAFGTAYIFEKRLSRARRSVRILTYMRLAVPIAIGGIVVAFFSASWLQPYLVVLIVIGSLLGTLFLVLTVWSLVANWNDTISFSATSAAENRRLASRFEALGQSPPSDFDIQFQLLRVENTRRQEADIQKEITEEEMRMITRAGLRQYQRACVECQKVPRDMIATTCPICGRF